MIKKMVVACVLLLVVGPLSADSAEFDLGEVRAFFPVADRLVEPEGKPPVTRIYRGNVLLGYAFVTTDIVPIPAYSGEPIDTLVAIDTTGTITGVRILAHEEPILVVGITEYNLQEFIDQYVGKSVDDTLQIGGRSRQGSTVLDGISGATITVMVLNAGITRSLEEVSKSLTLSDKAAPPGKASTAATAAKAHAPIWIQVWQERIFQIVVLALGLLVLLFILIMQDWLARHPRLLQRLRTGFLLYTVLFIGWYSLAQLSIVNVLTFLRSLFREFSWESFLIDPAMFILWSFVAVTIVLWGRGVYCGWLCPYGALQEFVYRVGRYLKVPSFEFPEVVHERLWAIKYVILLGLFGLSLHSMSLAEAYAEVEPFKTAITLRFQREWGFVFYALLMLLVSLFNRKFFCRYVCPLGAALTFPARFRIFDWLRRRKECGHPCQICRNECEVGSIRGTGEIVETECHYCLACQITYWNTQKCPPLIDKRRRQEKHRRSGGAVAAKTSPSDPPT
ncbi:MAG: 4Fe-4S binding protein [Pseudomonadota bacterium]|nr:4Fe-4S binding protein [Pseudomonadota bacterium]